MKSLIRHSYVITLRNAHPESDSIKLHVRKCCGWSVRHRRRQVLKRRWASTKNSVWAVQRISPIECPTCSRFQDADEKSKKQSKPPWIRDRITLWRQADNTWKLNIHPGWHKQRVWSYSGYQQCNRFYVGWIIMQLTRGGRRKNHGTYVVQRGTTWLHKSRGACYRYRYHHLKHVLLLLSGIASRAVGSN